MRQPLSEFTKLVMKLLLDENWDNIIQKLLELRNERLAKLIDYDRRSGELNKEIDEINELEKWLRSQE